MGIEGFSQSRPKKESKKKSPDDLISEIRTEMGIPEKEGASKKPKEPQENYTTLQRKVEHLEKKKTELWGKVHEQFSSAGAVNINKFVDTETGMNYDELSSEIKKLRARRDLLIDSSDNKDEILAQREKRSNRIAELNKAANRLYQVLPAVVPGGEAYLTRKDGITGLTMAQISEEIDQLEKVS